MEPQNIHIHHYHKLSSKYIFLLIIPVLVFVTVLAVLHASLEDKVAGLSTEQQP